MSSPVINGILPNSGISTGGVFVSISGFDFIAGATVTLSCPSLTRQCNNVTIVSSQMLTFTTPDMSAVPAQTMGVTITNTDSGTYTLAQAFKTLDPAAVTAETAEIEIIIDKTNLALTAAVTTTQTAPVVPVSVVNDGKHTHFNVDTIDSVGGAVGYFSLTAGNSINFDFGSPQLFKKITVFTCPKNSSAFGNPFPSGNTIEIQCSVDGITYTPINWPDFNAWMALPAVTQTNNATYTSLAGIISIYGYAGIQARYVKITAIGGTVGICEIEICDVLDIFPLNLRVSESADILNNYQGIDITAAVFDADFSIFNATAYNATAFISAVYRSQQKYFGILKIEAPTCDDETRITTLEFVNNFARLKDQTVDKQAPSQGINIYYNFIIEWLLAAGDIHRDLVYIDVFGADMPFFYVPENNDLQTELLDVCESAGDVEVLTRDGLLTVKGRTRSTIKIAATYAQGTAWTPVCNLFTNDFPEHGGYFAVFQRGAAVRVFCRGVISGNIRELEPGFFIRKHKFRVRPRHG